MPRGTISDLSPRSAWAVPVRLTEVVSNTPAAQRCLTAGTLTAVHGHPGTSGPLADLLRRGRKEPTVVAGPDGIPASPHMCDTRRPPPNRTAAAPRPGRGPMSVLG